MSWDDVYYDGRIDSKYEGFCEYAQQIVNLEINDGWDSYEESEEDVDWED